MASADAPPSGCGCYGHARQPRRRALPAAFVHVPLLNVAFGMAPLAVGQWLVRATMASVVLIYSKLQKTVAANLGSITHALQHPG